MTLLFNRAWFPVSEGNKLCNAYVDWVQDNPQDKSVIKMLGIGVTSSEDGEVLVYGFDTIINGKEKEALEYKQNKIYLWLLESTILNIKLK